VKTVYPSPSILRVVFAVVVVPALCCGCGDASRPAGPSTTGSGKESAGTLPAPSAIAGREPNQAAEDDEQIGLRTEQALGVPLGDFPARNEPDTLVDAGAPEFPFDLSIRAGDKAPPRVFYEKRKSVIDVDPGGDRFEAWCGYASDEKIDLGPGQSSLPGPGRREYGRHRGAGYIPSSIFIGSVNEGRLRPVLVFPDVGTHLTSPHDMTIDAHGACHLVVADVSPPENRLRLYWTVSDPTKRRWADARLIDHRRSVSWCRAWIRAIGDEVVLLWETAPWMKEPGSGIFCVSRRGETFSQRMRLASGEIDGWGAALSPADGRVVVAWCVGPQAFAVARTSGQWSRVVRLPPEINGGSSIEVLALPDARYTLRTDSKATLVLTPK
jgi:hypothetical protein